MNYCADAQELSRRFNASEAVNRAFENRRARRRWRDARTPLSTAVLDHLDWMEAEKECREVRCVGEMIP